MGDRTTDTLPMGVRFEWSLARVTKTLRGGILILLGMHLLMHSLKQIGHHRVLGLVELFDMDQEQNIPTLFSTLLFLVCGFLFFVVWRSSRGEKEGSFLWLVFAGAMVCMGIDEFGQLHEYLTDPVEKKLETSGFFGAAWVIPYGSAALLGLVAVLPFILRLEKGTRRLLITSAFVFLGGAVGVEMVTAKYVDIRWTKIGDEFNLFSDFGYGILVGLEESMEMLGLAIAIGALLRFLQISKGGVSLEISD